MATIPVCQNNCVAKFPGSGLANCFVLYLGFSLFVPTSACKRRGLVLSPRERKCSTQAICQARKSKEELLVVVGGGAAGVYGAIQAKTLAPHLNVVIIEKGKPLSKVKVSGGGRCNVTNGHCADNMKTIQGVTRN